LLALSASIVSGSATRGGFVYLDDVDVHYEAAKPVGPEIVHQPKYVRYAERLLLSIPKGIPGSPTSPPKAS
jgi:hypothetical protein